jgi:FAD/FMN-containing dehydrogenase
MRSRLGAVPGLEIIESAPLRDYTRFGIGGPARWLADASSEPALARTIQVIRENGEPHTVIGGGTNLIVSDDGFAGVVLRYASRAIEIEGTTVRVAAGAVLQQLVDSAIAAGLRGLETMTGIPGWVGGAIYGNAGAYGHSIHERVESVRFFDGASVREIGNAACEFRYRDSVFKRQKDWIILSAVLRLDRADPAELNSNPGQSAPWRPASVTKSGRTGPRGAATRWRSREPGIQSIGICGETTRETPRPGRRIRHAAGRRPAVPISQASSLQESPPRSRPRPSATEAGGSLGAAPPAGQLPHAGVQASGA